MGRPVGVTILAILDFIGAALCLLGGIGMLVGGSAIGAAISQQAGSSGGGGIFAMLGAAAGVFMLVFAAIAALLGWGLWGLKNWARIITIVLMGINIAFGLLGLVAIFAHFNVLSFIWSVFWMAIYALVIWYLLKPEVKAAFQGQARAAAA
jgi:hypothetical protein